MPLQPDDYVTYDERSSLGKWMRRLLVVALLAFSAAWLTNVTVRVAESHIDAITGSIQLKTIWPLGITFGPRVIESPLEIRLKSLGVTSTRTWRLLHRTHRNIVGRATCYQCGFAPPIRDVQPLLDEFVVASTDDELRAFVQEMQSGIESDQQATVDAVGLKLLE